MKKLMYLFLSIVPIFYSCSETNMEDDGIFNSLLGEWVCEDGNQKLITTFHSDHTSSICTYDLKTGELLKVDLQGEFVISDNNVLDYHDGRINKFIISEDGNKIDITYGCEFNDNAREITFSYLRYNSIFSLEFENIDEVKEKLDGIEPGLSVSFPIENAVNVKLSQVCLRKENSNENIILSNAALGGGVINFTMPTDITKGIYSLIIIYTINDEEKELILENICNVKLPTIYEDAWFFENQMLSGRESVCILSVKENKNLSIETACYIKDDIEKTDEENKNRRASIDLFSGIYTSGSDSYFVLGNFEKIGKNLQYYKCDGEQLLKTSETDATKIINQLKTLYPGIEEITTKFAVLRENVSEEKAIIDMVRNKTLKQITPIATPALFNGTTVFSKIMVQSEYKAIKDDPIMNYKNDGVIAFKNYKKDKIGLIHVKELKNNDGKNDHKDTEFIFDLYYQGNIISQ